MEIDLKKIIIMHISKGTTLKNWTPRHNYTGNDLTVLSVDKDSGKITIDLPTSKYKKVDVTVSDISQLYHFWNQIKSGDITRTQYTNTGIKSRKTRYILNILKYLEDINVLQ